MNGLLNAVPIAALSESRTLFEFGLVVVLAAAAPLIGQVLRLPSILMLLPCCGGALGPARQPSGFPLSHESLRA